MYNMRFELNIIWFAWKGRPHKHTLTQWCYSPSGTLARHSITPFCSILHHSTAPTSNISGLSSSKKIAGHICHTQYPTSNVLLQEISFFLISKFFNFQKCKNIKYSLFLIFQDILDTSYNTVSSYHWTGIQILIEHLTRALKSTFLDI